MPWASPRPCRAPRCPRLTRDGYCEEHRSIKRAGSGQPRASAHARGYGRQWQRYRAAYLLEHPLCVDCQAEGVIERATDVDHVVAVDGPDDPRFWDETNHAARCHSHHSRKTAAEDGAFGRPKRQ